MDVKCATCQEPWEAYYLLHDVVWDAWDGEEGSSSHLLIKKFLSGSKTSIPPMLRDDLKEHGWIFGKAIVCVLECACCASNAADGELLEDVEIRKSLRLEAEELLGNDLDGLISTLESIDRFA